MKRFILLAALLLTLSGGLGACSMQMQNDDQTRNASDQRNTADHGGAGY